MPTVWGQLKKSVQTPPSQKGKAWQVLHFLFESMVLLPVVGIAVGAYAFDVPTENILVFAAFAFTAISMEICWSCIVHAVMMIMRLGEMARLGNKYDHPKTQEVEERLSNLKYLTAVFVLATMLTLVGWLFIAIFEIRHLLLKENDGLWHHYFLLGLFSLLNFTLAMGKLWLRSNDYDDELIDSLAKDGLKGGQPPDLQQ